VVVARPSSRLRRLLRFAAALRVTTSRAGLLGQLRAESKASGSRSRPSKLTACATAIAYVLKIPRICEKSTMGALNDHVILSSPSEIRKTAPTFREDPQICS
jgi:hypothetical protein